VRPDGRVSFPLIGDVQATGLTITELDADITERLKEFIRHPEVSISIRKIGGQRVLILGEVMSPGIYSVKGAKTALEAVGLAGGFTRDSVPSSTVLIRGGFQKPDAKRINLSKALKGDLRENASLQPEDILFVPKKFIANLNYFLNQVIGPLAQGAYADTQLRYLQRGQ
jgi:polysaccharide export outer membrane protein